jgi:hypothetical protein
MLVYVREGERNSIMKEVTINDIPSHLTDRFDEENRFNSKLERD